MYVKYSERFNNVIFSLTIKNERRNQLTHKAGFIIFFEVVFVDRYMATNEINKNKKSRFIHHF
jgi:predicted membrane channel-forming protein YqfA (hemolysin III family)